jgi:hypothetical protein
MMGTARGTTSLRSGSTGPESDRGTSARSASWAIPFQPSAMTAAEVATMARTRPIGPSRVRSRDDDERDRCDADRQGSSVEATGGVAVCRSHERRARRQRQRRCRPGRRTTRRRVDPGQQAIGEPVGDTFDAQHDTRYPVVTQGLPAQERAKPDRCRRALAVAAGNHRPQRGGHGRQLGVSGSEPCDLPSVDTWPSVASRAVGYCRVMATRSRCSGG